MANSTRLWPTIRRLLSYGKPWRKSLGLAVLMLWLAAAAEVLGPVLISYFIDQMVAQHHMPIALAAGLITSYLLLQLLAALLHRSEEHTSELQSLV